MAVASLRLVVLRQRRLVVAVAVVAVLRWQGLRLVVLLLLVLRVHVGPADLGAA